MAAVDPVVRARPAPPAHLRRALHLTRRPLLPFAQAFFSKSGKDGVSVRSHLAELIHKLLISKDADALAKLESLSLEVKQAHFDAAQPGSKVPDAPEKISLRHTHWRVRRLRRQRKKKRIWTAANILRQRGAVPASARL